MRIIISGSRSFTHYPVLHRVCNHYLQNVPDPLIVCGHARGADSLAFQYANEKGLPVKSFHPGWPEHGKAAGVIRNEQMARYGHAVLAFWNGKSRGTRNMLGHAKKQGLAIRVFYFNQLFNELEQPF